MAPLPSVSVPMVTSGCALTRRKVRTGRSCSRTTGSGTRRGTADAVGYGTDGSTDLDGASCAARTSTAESLPFLWHRRQCGLPEGADFVGSDIGCDWLPLAV